ncbi:helix-turn-helix domain-containing protein [Streptomyces antibioticus]|uniref:DNA-binding protein n=1 Tax=Streptomyces antibioticus TaxID=1890 RepID=A0AAE6Y444_STRAT|nr:helix-turn-helix transcriptional regulator [Streptomyces antibioticus]MCX4743517.1 helix-turn-helix domain-containing protein [Streptomyces antibioticus]OOQ55063.1 DNA-binding protein [Streptomyces antibioticus]QIT42703.1 helix-turn-helix domain-containing protein [Streptomyces antibioticus]
MATSPSSSAQAQRDRVARRLRDLRADAGLTGTELAARCGWTHPKTSRLENGRTPPSPDDIRRWCRACDAEDQAPDIIAQSRDAESAYVEWRRQVRTGLRRLQDSYVDLYRATSLFRIYSPTLVPGVLQTEGYARGILSGVAELYEAPNDVDEAAAARMERSKIVHEPGHRFVMVIEEAVLKHQMGDSDAMAAQLGYLLTAGALPSVSLGIIPTTVQRTLWPQELFHVYDDQMVSVELMSARVRVTQPTEVALYVTAFERLRGMAVYGAEARALILRAIEQLR